MDYERRAPKTYFVIGLGAALGIYLFAALLLLPMLGLENDEALFADGVLHPEHAFMQISMPHLRIPLMLNSYVGASKSWLYEPIFAFSGYSVETVRIPVVILAILTLALLGSLLREISSSRAGLFVTWLMATDVTFLLTETFDWGPVVIQNLLLTLGLLCLVAWSKRDHSWLLFGCGLAFGLALWDKALFVWNLSGMIAMFLILQPRFLIHKVRLRGALLAILGIGLGALPLIAYNVNSRGSTLQDNAHLSIHDFGRKLNYLLYAIDGGISAVAFSDIQHRAPDRIARPFAETSLRLDATTPLLSTSWRRLLFAALLAIGLLCAKAAERKWILFFVGTAALSWIQSAITIGAGQSIHNSVLIWPLLYSGIAVCADSTARRLGRWGTPFLAALTITFSLRALLLINHAYSSMLSYSPIVQFSNADAALASYLEHIGAHRIASLDWGIANPISVRTGGSIAVLEDSYALHSHNSITQDVLICKADPACVFVAHPDARQLFLDVNASTQAELTRMHLQMEPLSEIYDSHGTSSLTVFRVRRAE
jgi:hypothetical protein